MGKHKEKILRLIKMMEAINKENRIENKERYINMKSENLDKYIEYERLISIRELSKMIIEELNSEYMQCKYSDEVVAFIEKIIDWIEAVYNYTIDNNASSNNVKTLKICSQLVEDYTKVYDDASKVYARKDGDIIFSINKNGFEFGKRNKLIKENYTINNSLQQPITINLSINGDKTNIDEFTKLFEKYVKDAINNLSGR